jgi:hypothetical protein
MPERLAHVVRDADHGLYADLAVGSGVVERNFRSDADARRHGQVAVDEVFAADADERAEDDAERIGDREQDREAPQSVRSSTPCRKVKLTPGQPASAWMTLLPEPTVRPAVAFHPVSPMGMMVAAVPGYCSACARPALAEKSRTAAAHHATVRIKEPPFD